MAYSYYSCTVLKAFTMAMFEKHGFSEDDSRCIAEVLLSADLFGIESHGIQRLIRYHKALLSGEVQRGLNTKTIHETPISAVLDAGQSMGHIVGIHAMDLAIEKAKLAGIGMVAVRNSSHYGIAGYYTTRALDADFIGLCLTNTEAIAPPTFGRRPMLGTNPIAFAMPADPIPFWFDASTTVVPLGKMEVYKKQEKPLPTEWAVDSDGQETRDAAKVISNLRSGRNGGLLPLGGWGETHGGHKGYGLSVMVDLCTAVLSGGMTAPHMKGEDGEHTCHFFCAMDYGVFGDKAQIRMDTSRLLQELRESPKAAGQARIYTHGEKAWESKAKKLFEGIGVQQKTMEEIYSIASDLKLDFYAFFPGHSPI